MDPISIGAIAALILSKALDKGVDKAASKTADSAAGAIQRLLGWVRGRASLEPSVSRLEEAPDSRRRTEDLATAIDAAVADDAEGMAELEDIVNEINRISANGDVYQIGSITASTGGIAAARIEGGITISELRRGPSQGHDAEPSARDEEESG